MVSVAGDACSFWDALTGAVGDPSGYALGASDTAHGTLFSLGDWMFCYTTAAKQ